MSQPNNKLSLLEIAGQMRQNPLQYLMVTSAVFVEERLPAISKRLIQSVVECEPGSWANMLNLAITLFENSEYRESLSAARQAEELLGKRHLQINRLTALTYDKLGLTQMALTEFELLGSEYPMSETIWVDLLKIYDTQKMTDKSMEAAERLVFIEETEPHYELFANRLMNSVQEKGSWDFITPDQICKIEEGLVQFPKNAQLNMLLAEYYLSVNEMNSCERLAAVVLETEPDNLRAEILLAVSLYNQLRYSEACLMLRQINGKCLNEMTSKIYIQTLIVLAQKTELESYLVYLKQNKPFFYNQLGV